MAAVRSVAEAGGLNRVASHADGRPKNREYARLNWEALSYSTVLVTGRFWPEATRGTELLIHLLRLADRYHLLPRG